jgi:hypothetical protein
MLTCVPVDNRVELWIVIHLHLTVEFEAPGTVGDLGEERTEASGEVAGLQLEQDETGGVALAVGLGCGVTLGLDAGMKDLKVEDGEAVDDEARGLGVQGCGGVLLGEVGEQPFVHLFHKVVAALVETVDGVFDACDLGVGGLGVAGLVLFVPEIEVLAVLGCYQLQEWVGGEICFGFGRWFVPGAGEGLVKAGDGGGFEHRHRDCISC